ncbi:MAG: Yip1 family protein [Woeseiaceae bacterium]|nr:Yip1 family protein [Woeseiaceae bacterium]
MIDLARTFSLIRGGVFDPEKTWRDYLPEADDWQKTALLLTGPLIILSAVAAYLIGFLGSGVSLFGQFRPTIMTTIVAMISSAIAAGVVAFIVGALAGAFGGKGNFALGLAATTFAFIPGYIGQAVLWVPWVGGLLALGLFIYSLVLLWKIIPIFLGVPDGKRTGHFILSLIGSVAAMIVLSITLGRFMGPSMPGPSFGGMPDMSSPGSSVDGGLYGGLARQGELMAAAEEDRYEPPSNGRVSKSQVREFIRVMQRTEELQQQKMKQLEELAERAENDEEVSFRDLGAMMSGMGEAAGMQTSEIEVVKSAGGNWAEHRWVRESLRTAWIQKDINDAVAHNYELYQEFEGELAPHIAN